MIILIVGCASLQLAPCIAADTGFAGFELEQKGLVVGKTTVRACPKAFQITDQAKGMMYLSKAPNWDLLIINPSAQSYYDCKIQDFSGYMNRGITLFTGRTLMDTTYAPKPTKESNGLLHYTSDAQYTKRESEMKKNLRNENGQPKTVDVWVDPLVPVTPKAASLASRLYGFAATKEMPVTVVYHDFDNEKKVYLTTLKLAKKTFTDNDFGKKLPTYRRVNSILAVYRSPQQDANLDDVLQGLRP